MFADPRRPRARRSPARTPRPRRSRRSARSSASTSPSTCSTASSSGVSLHGDLGRVATTLPAPVTEMIRENAPNTIQLAIAAVLIELLGIPLGIYSALRQYSFWDTTLTTAALIIWGIPVFVLGVFMQWFFGLKLRPVCRSSGAGDNVLWIIPANWNSFADAHPAGRHAGPHRGRLHLVHAARLDARGHPLRLHPHGAGQGSLASARSCASTPSRTPSSRS